MRNNLKLSIGMLLFFMSFSLTSQAQFGKKLKEKLGLGESSSATEEKEEEAKEPAALVLNDWHKANEGKVVFYNKSIVYDSSSESDSESKVITERVVAGDGAFSFRAYLGKNYKEFPSADGIDIRYTLGGVSVTTDQIREELDQYYYRMASLYAFYDYDHGTIGVPLDSDAGKYYDMYTLQEDAYRILLSRVQDKLTVGASLPLKVEIIGNVEGQAEMILASGEITMKVTSASSNLQSLNCRCGKAGMTDAKVIQDVKDAFEFQLSDVKKVYKVVLLDRDFTENFGDSYPQVVMAKGMKANIIYENTEGVFMMVKRYIFYKKEGANFSDIATIGGHDFYLPVSPTCAK